jgi:RimJ/RimL family protein N-acetyltransferase
MDGRIRKWIESKAGLPLSVFPHESIRVRISTARTDEPKNRLLAQRIIGKNGVLITVIPRILETISRNVNDLTVWELFSALGIAEIKRALPPEGAKSIDEIYGLDYFLTDLNDFHQVTPRHPVTPLHKRDIPQGDEALRISERRSTEKGDFTWAFASYHNNPSIPAKVISKYGPCCASVAAIIWKNDDIAGFGVATEEALRGQGYALDVVSAGTQFILDQKGTAWYGAYADNIPSLRIAKKLGYSLVHSSFTA